jgi:hypothetical protein
MRDHFRANGFVQFASLVVCRADYYDARAEAMVGYILPRDLLAPLFLYRRLRGCSHAVQE